MAWCLALRLVCEYRIEMLYGDRESLKEVRCAGQVTQNIYWYSVWQP